MRGCKLFILVGFLILCVFVLWVNAQVEKKPLEPIPIGQTTGERLPQYQPSSLQPIATLQGQDGIAYQVREFKDFRRGLDLVSTKTKGDPTCAIELENALWNPQGEMYKRPGCSVHSTPPFIPNLLYRYYQQDGDAWTMGGSDTALYFWHEDSSGDGWTYLTGTEGTSGRWDGATFEDLFVATHEGIVPVVWNGSTFVTMGTSADSFEMHSGIEKNADSPCYICSVQVSFEGNPGWDTGDWADYILFFPALIETSSGKFGWFDKKAIIISNIYNKVYLRHLNTWGGVGYISPTIYEDDKYAKILSWFQVDTVWRTGTLDSATEITTDGYGEWMAKAWDKDFYWDSTFNYNDYIFEVISGDGEGKKIFLANWNYGFREALGVGWDTLAFIIPGYGADCFDTTTTYRIYKPSFWEGSKFVEGFDGSLWLGWTGIGDEQEKNRVVWSGLNDLGNWPPENEVWIESDDGDFITGMAKFPGEYTDVPRQEMIVSKNNSLYKIVPSGDAYNFWLIQSGVGCVSNSAISPAEGILLFPDQHGVWAYDKRKPVSISAKIDPIFEEWNLDALENVSAIYNPQDRHYYLSYPDSVYSDTGRVVVVWEDNRDDPLGDIYAQVLIGYDSIIGSNILVCNAQTEAGDNDTFQVYPDVASDAQGNFVVVWADARMGNYDIYGRRYDFNGNPLGSDFVIAGSAEKEQFPTISMLPDGRFAVSWDQDQGTEIIYLYTKVYNSAGQLISTTRLCDECDMGCWCCDYPCSDACPCPEGECCCGTCVCCGAYNYNLDHPCVGYDYSGMVNVVWSDHRHPATNDGFDIYGNSVNRCGQRIHRCDNGIQVSDPNSIEPCIGIFYDGGFVTCWTEQVNDFDVYKTGAVVVNDNTTGAQRFPRVDVDKDNNCVIVWEDDRSGTQQIYGQRYDSDGDAVGVNFAISDSSVYEQEEPDVAMDAGGSFVVVWDDDRVPPHTGQHSDVYLRRYDSGGNLVGSSIKINDDEGIDDHSHVRVALSKGTYSPSANSKTIAWSLDHHSWSRESFSASAYAYQHSLSDTTAKIIFAHPSGGVYNYATQADDVDDAVILTYQTPYVNFGQYPSFDYEMRFATVEAFLDTGNIYLTWYKNYNDSVYYDSLICGSDCREEMLLPEDLWGKNISMKLETGSNIDDFTLSRFWWEWTVNQKFRK